MDFLSSLVERALERVPVLERRRPSLFEPSAGMTQPPGMPLETFSLEIEQERDERQSEHRESPESLRAEPRVKETSGEENAVRSLARKESTDAHGFTAAPLHVTETIVEREVETVRFLEPSERTSAQGNQTLRVAQPQASPAIKPVVIQSISAGPYDEKRDASLQERRAESGMPIAPRRAARKELLRPVAAPRRSLASVQSQPLVQNATQAETSVQVTIGRVEVRATQPPAQKRAAQRPAPAKLSLEDYLKARGGGNR
jgi:hypothetical protein